MFVISERSINLDPQKLSETELTVLLANHLFGKLATSNCYVIDKSIPGKRDDRCFCDDRSCKMTGQYGDTSVGKTNIYYWILSKIRPKFEALKPLENVVPKH